MPVTYAVQVRHVLQQLHLFSYFCPLRFTSDTQPLWSAVSLAGHCLAPGSHPEGPAAGVFPARLGCRRQAQHHRPELREMKG